MTYKNTHKKIAIYSREVRRMGEILQNAHELLLEGKLQAASFEFGAVRMALDTIATSMELQPLRDDLESVSGGLKELMEKVESELPTPAPEGTSD